MADERSISGQVATFHGVPRQQLLNASANSEHLVVDIRSCLEQGGWGVLDLRLALNESMATGLTAYAYEERTQRWDPSISCPLARLGGEK